MVDITILSSKAVLAKKFTTDNGLHKKEISKLAK